MIFLGAGASAPFGLPISPKLTEEMRSLLDRDLLSTVDTHFRHTRGRKPNYEDLLTILTAYTNPTEIRSDHYSHDFARLHQEHKRDYTSIIENMHEKVCNYCTAPFIRGTETYLKPEELETKFRMTYDPLIGIVLSHGFSDLVFSTNYDPSLEIWCQKRNLRCVDGTRPTQNPEVKLVESSQRFTSDLGTLKRPLSPAP